MGLGDCLLVLLVYSLAHCGSLTWPRLHSFLLNWLGPARARSCSPGPTSPRSCWPGSTRARSCWPGPAGAIDRLAHQLLLVCPPPVCSWSSAPASARSCWPGPTCIFSYSPHPRQARVLADAMLINAHADPYWLLYSTTLCIGPSFVSTSNS